MSEETVNLLGLPRAELERFFAGVGEKPFRARQFMRWVYARGETDPARMTDMSLELRREIATRLALPAITAVQESADGTIKWRLSNARKALGRALEVERR